MRQLALAMLLLASGASGHAALSFPRPRNAADGSLAPWTSWAYPCDKTHSGANCSISFCEHGHDCQGSCPIAARSGVKGALTASNGQACYWFSNGCTVGCARCDGSSNHVGHGSQRFLFKGMSAAALRARNLSIEDPFSPPPGALALNQTTAKSLAIAPNCADPKTAPTVCDPRLRTANTQAACGSKEDVYYYSPWRAPGAAPVIDACGMAGGRFPGQGVGGAGAQFQNSSVMRQGDAGSALPRGPPAAVWRAGDSPEVGWTVMANHGGGYAYRLAPADAPLTENTFRKLPLAFDGPSALRWDGDRAADMRFDSAARGWQVSTGTVPAGSSWRKNPIPSGLWEREGPTFRPVCDESAACVRGYSTGGAAQGECRCSGWSNGGPLLPNVEVVDRVALPASLSPGRYVLQWRWDCEESDQVWASCSDVQVVAAATGAEPEAKAGVSAA